MHIFLIGLAFYVTQFFGAMLPGPDMLIVIRNSLRYGRVRGMATALGVATFLTIYCTIAVFSIAIIRTKYLLAFKVVSCVGALYLLYLSYKCFKSAKEFNFKDKLQLGGDKEISLLIDSIIENNYKVIPRIQLEATVRHPDGVEETHHALNEVTLNRGVTGRLVEIEALIDGDLLNYYRADGLIVATPTGSTAYSLAAGGPLISPRADVFVITPICPHSLTNRSVILSQSSIVELKCADDDDAPNIFTVDGRVIIEVAKGGSVMIKKSPYVINLIHLENRSFYTTLRTKLQWK